MSLLYILDHNCYPGTMRLRLTALLWLLVLRLSAQACPVFPHLSLNGQSTVTFGSGAAWVSGTQSYSLPDGLRAGWAAVSDDGGWVVVADEFGLQRFFKGKACGRGPLPLPLIGRIVGGWLSVEPGRPPASGWRSRVASVAKGSGRTL